MKACEKLVFKFKDFKCSARFSVETKNVLLWEGKIFCGVHVPLAMTIRNARSKSGKKEKLQKKKNDIIALSGTERFV